MFYFSPQKAPNANRHIICKQIEENNEINDY